MRSTEELGEELEAIRQALAKRSFSEDKLRRLAEVVERLRELVSPKDLQAIRQALTKGSILELKGLGKEIWRGIDVDAYIKEERASWR
jgi:hypothetical protein